MKNAILSLSIATDMKINNRRLITLSISVKLFILYDQKNRILILLYDILTNDEYIGIFLCDNKLWSL